MTRERARRLAFYAYVPLLFLGTHWPKATIPGPGRPDLLVHIAAFGLWGGLFIGCGFFGRPTSFRNVVLCWPLSSAFAGLDEVTQAIPVLYRTAGWDDWAANVAGITLASLIALALGRRSAGRVDDGAPQTPNL